jgi:hypothetical protein
VRVRWEVEVVEGHLEEEGLAEEVVDGDTVDGQRKRRRTSKKDQNFMRRGIN